MTTTLTFRSEIPFTGAHYDVDSVDLAMTQERERCLDDIRDDLLVAFDNGHYLMDRSVSAIIKPEEIVDAVA